jgi:hypothetical protein
MTKREKVNFTNLENVFPEKGRKSYTNEELLSVIRNPGSLVEKDEAERLLIIGAIVELMQSSEDFKRKVLEEIVKSRQKPHQ